MVLSRYCYFFTSSTGVNLGYSSRTNSFIELTPHVFNHLKDGSQSKTPLNLAILDEESSNILTSQGFIGSATSDEDFIHESQFITQAVQHNKSKLNLVLVPSLNCNFACPYCFETDKRARYMTPSVVEKLISFIRDNEGKSNIDLKWYGGEPLMSLSVINSILDRLNIEKDVKIQKHSIITNGYLFNEEAISLFKKYPLDIIQITLDGQKERHNHLRSLKKSLKPTFDIIVSNIKNIVRELTTTKIHIRVNIDKTNLDDFFIVKEFIETEVGSSNIIVYPGIIRLENDSKTNLVEPSFSRWETAELLFNLFSNGDLNGSIYPTLHKAKTCCAMCVNSFIIGPYGEISKCWNDVSDETKIVGYINDPKIKNPQIFYRYHTACAWYNDKECRDCFFLPICNGKCAWYGERNLFHGGKYNLCQCMQKAPDLLNNCLEAYYNKITKS